MPPLPTSSRISNCGNFAASSAMPGGTNALCFASVAVSAAAPILSRQAGQSPASAPGGSGVPHCGHLFASGIGSSIFTVSIPTSEAKPDKRYRKNFISAQLESTLKNHFRSDDNQKNRADERVEAEER